MLSPLDFQLFVNVKVTKRANFEFHHKMPVKSISDKQVSTVEKGQLLHEEKPFVQVLSADLITSRCDHCYSKGDLLKCSACSYVRYCDTTCQKAEWLIHKLECQSIRRLPPNRVLPNSARLLAKIIFKLKKGGDSEKGYYARNKFRIFKDLMSHYPEMKNDPKRVEHATSLYGVLTDFLGADNLPNYPEFVGIYGRMVVNSFSILDGEMTTLGTGIYLGASTIDHACSPNAVAVFSGTTLLIRALKDIPQYEWTKVRISYVDCLSIKEDRQKELWTTYYFECDCVKCKEDAKLETAAMCQQCKGVIYAENMICENCEWQAPDSFISKYKDVMNLSIHQHQEMKTVAYLDACKLIIEKEEGVLHPSNLVHTKSLDLAFEAAIQLKSWDEAVRLGKELIPGYRIYYGDWHPLTGILLMKVGKILLFLERNESVEVLEDAEKVLRRSHGTRHYIYRRLLEPLIYQAKNLGR